MAKTISQKVIFKNTAPKELYDLYMDAKKHSAVTQSKAKINAKVGAAFSAYNGFILGKNLQLVKDKQIVQSWRGSDWKKTDTDSTFIINLEAKGKDTVLHMTHANIPDQHVKGITSGWHEFYWDLWKDHLKGE